MLNQFLQLIAKKNPLQEKYLKFAMNDITQEELKKLENLFSFFIHRGETIESIVEKYLAKINFIMKDQFLFLQTQKYRYSTFKETEELYKNKEYMESYLVGLALSQYVWISHRQIMRFFIRKITEQNRTEQNRTYLEIGPGHGEYFVTAMQNTNYSTYTAVDISESSVAVTNDFCTFCVKDKKKINIIQKDFFDYSATEKFDAIIMGEVLEHVENPLAFLQKIYELSKTETFIFITTAINAPQPDHIFLFNNLQEIFLMCQRAQFEVVEYIAIPSNNVTLEKALNNKSAIVVGLVLKKMEICQGV